MSTTQNSLKKIQLTLDQPPLIEHIKVFLGLFSVQSETGCVLKLGGLTRNDPITLVSLDNKNNYVVSLLNGHMTWYIQRSVN